MSSTTAQQLPPSQKSQSIEAASNRLAELIELAKKTFSDDTGRSINENNLWIKSDNHLKGEDKSSSSSPKNNYNLRRPHSVYELNKTDTMNNNNDNGYSTLPTRGKSATRSFRKSSITSNDPDDIINAEKSAWYRSIYKQLHQVEPEGGKFFFPSCCCFFFCNIVFFFDPLSSFFKSAAANMILLKKSLLKKKIFFLKWLK